MSRSALWPCGCWDDAAGRSYFCLNHRLEPGRCEREAEERWVDRANVEVE